MNDKQAAQAVDDLISRLTAAIDEREASSEEIHRRDCDSNTDRSVTHACDCGESSRVRVECAADRKVLGIHPPLEVFNGSAESKYWPKHAGTPGFPVNVICERCASEDSERGWDDDDPDVHYPCPTLKATAEPYGLEVDRG